MRENAGVESGCRRLRQGAEGVQTSLVVIRQHVLRDEQVIQHGWKAGGVGCQGRRSGGRRWPALM